MAQMVKHPSTMRETWVRSLGREESLEKEMATHSSTLAYKIPRTEEPGVHGVTKSWTRLSNFTFTFKLESQGWTEWINPAGLKIRKTYKVKCFKIKVSTITASNLTMFPSRSYKPLDKTKACVFLLGESTINPCRVRALGTYPPSPAQNLTECGSVSQSATSV